MRTIIGKKYTDGCLEVECLSIVKHGLFLAKVRSVKSLSTFVVNDVWTFESKKFKLIEEEFKIGKVYKSICNNYIILCAGKGKMDSDFAGTVLGHSENTNLKYGEYCDSWKKDAFLIHTFPVTINGSPRR